MKSCGEKEKQTKGAKNFSARIRATHAAFTEWFIKKLRSSSSMTTIEASQNVEEVITHLKNIKLAQYSPIIKLSPLKETLLAEFFCRQKVLLSVAVVPAETFNQFIE